MFGLTFEKLFVVAVLAAVLIGPSRLPAYAQRLAELVRAARRLVDESRATARDDLGLPVERAAWSALDLRDYDPRRIVRDAWNEPTPTPTADADPLVLEQAASIRPGQQYLVVGSAAHPQRIRLASLPADDPRRLAAEASPSSPLSTRSYSASSPPVSAAASVSTTSSSAALSASASDASST